MVVERARGYLGFGLEVGSGIGGKGQGSSSTCRGCS